MPSGGDTQKEEQTRSELRLSIGPFPAPQGMSGIQVQDLTGFLQYIFVLIFTVCLLNT